VTAARGQVPPGEEAGRGEHGPALVLLRHGESTANAAGLFTGVWDVPLTTRGRAQAARAASLMAAVGIRPTLLLTSPLVRAVQTVEILREKGGWESTTMLCPELTERGYGALTGLRKDAVADLFGAERTHHWRRGG
jgi:2,3-bisphosphoglycerate-dependent phosphoglycerate mutase